MNRILLIARREYAAYARTVGFWLSLLALPLFAVLGAAVPMLIKNSEPVRAVALIEEGAAASGLAQSVRDALARDAERRVEIAREATEKTKAAAGMASAPAMVMTRQRLRLVEPPADIVDAAPGEARDAAVRRHLGEEAPEGDRLDAVVFLTRQDGKPAARVWTARATDDAVEDFVRDALRAANRQTVFAEAGIDPQVVREAERFRPEVVAFSPRSVSDGGQVSFRDRLPMIVGLISGFLLWSLILTGASILLNSVMEEKANKILEVLLSSASATEILTGKVLGVALLTLTVLAAWGGIGAAGLISAAPQQAADVGEILLKDGLLFYFAAFMVGGYLMYAVLFAAIGAFCETPRDAQTLMGPIMMVMVIPMMTMSMAMTSPDASVVRLLSLIPLFTPFLMMARLPADPPMVEVVLAMAGMFAVSAFMVWMAGRAFRAGALSDVKLSWKSFVSAVRGGGR